MDKTLIIYDSTGCLLQQITGSYRVPIGVPYLVVVIPAGKRLKNTDGVVVDMSSTPHQVSFEDIPLTEIEQLKQTVADLTEIVLMGGM